MQIHGYDFTKRMEATLWDAVGEAQALNHEYIGTEHLLLAILADRDGSRATVLRNLGVDLHATSNRVLSVVRPGVGGSDPRSGALLPLTSRTKKALELAKVEAQALSHSKIDTEHLLLGMLAEGKGVAAQVLMEAGVTLGTARSQVAAILGTTSDDPRYRTSEVTAGEQPAFVRVVLGYQNGAVISKQFTTTREAKRFLDEQDSV